MADDRPAKTLDWIAVLRPNQVDDVKQPPRYIKAPEHFPHILKAFGPLVAGDFRHVVLALDDIVIGYKSVQKRRPMKFKDAEKLLGGIENSLGKLLTAWERAAALHPAILWSMINATPLIERRTRKFHGFPNAGRDILLAVRALRDPNTYRAATGLRSQKSSERALLWEPLFDLMNRFGLRAREFSKHQPLLTTLKKLHLAIGIDPPNEHIFKQAVKDRRKKEAGG